jgi:hypothetical protein
MKTALDTSVILDVVLGPGAFADSSERAIREAAQQGTLLVCECVLAEISPAFTGLDIEEFLRDWNIVFEPGSRQIVAPGREDARDLPGTSRHAPTDGSRLSGGGACPNPRRQTARP